MKSTMIVSMLLLSLCLSINAQEKNCIIRKGFVFGSSIGAAESSLKFPANTKNLFDLALDLKIGYMLNPNLALLITSNVSTYDYVGVGRARKRDFGVLAPTIQYWTSDKLWISGGIGMAGDAPVFYDLKNPDTNTDETKYYNGIGFVTSVGYEILKSKKKIIDIKGRLTYRDVNISEGNTTGFSFAVLLGINFYH